MKMIKGCDIQKGYIINLNSYDKAKKFHHLVIKRNDKDMIERLQKNKHLDVYFVYVKETKKMYPLYKSIKNKNYNPKPSHSKNILPTEKSRTIGIKMIGDFKILPLSQTVKRLDKSDFMRMAYEEIKQFKREAKSKNKFGDMLKCYVIKEINKIKDKNIRKYALILNDETQNKNLCYYSYKLALLNYDYDTCNISMKIETYLHNGNVIESIEPIKASLRKLEDEINVLDECIEYMDIFNQMCSDFNKEKMKHNSMSECFKVIDSSIKKLYNELESTKIKYTKNKDLLYRHYIDNNEYEEDTTYKPISQGKYVQVSPDAKPTILYLLKANGCHKIGVSHNVESRIKQLQTGNPYRIIEIASKRMDNVEEIEKELHKKYSEKRLMGEWFKLDSKDISDIKEFMNK